MRKIELGGINVPVINADFGSPMGFSLNPLDWFSSSAQTFTPSQELSAGNSWLQQLHTELKPNATYSKFIDSLHLDSYNERIPEEDFQDFVRTVGFAKLTNETISNNVKAAIIRGFSSNKNMLPTRKSISSAFLDPTNVKWTYWDATKMVAADAATTTKNVATTAANVVSSGASLVGFISKNLPVIAVIGVAGVGYLVYKNRNLVMERVNEKALKAVGLGK